MNYLLNIVGLIGITMFLIGLILFIREIKNAKLVDDL